MATDHGTDQADALRRDHMPRSSRSSSDGSEREDVQEISLALTPGQVAQVLAAAARGAGQAPSLYGVEHPRDMTT